MKEVGYCFILCSVHLRNEEIESVLSALAHTKSFFLSFFFFFFLGENTSLKSNGAFCLDNFLQR